MAFFENERIQDISLIIADKIAPVSKKWWYALVAAIILVIPVYSVFKNIFVQQLVGNYQGPALINSAVAKQPLQIADKKIFVLSNQTYSGFIKIKNINLEWGVAKQDYSVAFKTNGGTIVNTFNRSTFILPASEKLIALPLFVSDKQPDEIVFSLSETHFIHKPNINVDLELSRSSFQNSSDGLVVSSAFKNLTPFTIKQVDLPVAVYNSKNEIVAVNMTNVNDVKAGETRTFQYTWPVQVPGAVRVEINPEVNVFDRGILTTQEGVSPF